MKATLFQPLNAAGLFLCPDKNLRTFDKKILSSNEERTLKGRSKWRNNAKRALESVKAL